MKYDPTLSDAENITTALYAVVRALECQAGARDEHAQQELEQRRAQRRADEQAEHLEAEAQRERAEAQRERDAQKAAPEILRFIEASPAGVSMRDLQHIALGGKSRAVHMAAVQSLVRDGLVAISPRGHGGLVVLRVEAEPRTAASAEARAKHAGFLGGGK